MTTTTTKRPNLTFKIHNPSGVRVATFHYADDAAMFLGSAGVGYTARIGRTVLWSEGVEDQSAAVSYDNAADTMIDRARAAGLGI